MHARSAFLAAFLAASLAPLAASAFGLALLCTVTATLTLSTPALAFRPSAKWLLDKTMEKAIDRGSKSLKVDATVQLYDGNGVRVARASGEDIGERVWLSSSGALSTATSSVSNLRRETDQDGGPLVELRADGKSIVRAAGQAEKSQKAGVDILADVMVAAPPLEPGIAADKLIAAFKGLGVNTEVVSYARFDGRVAYLIGSKPWETDKPQVWIEKDSFLPVRIVTFQKGSDGANVKLDIRYLGWGSPVGGNWYPQTVEVWRNDKLARRSSAQAVERNVAVDASLFK